MGKSVPGPRRTLARPDLRLTKRGTGRPVDAPGLRSGISFATAGDAAAGSVAGPPGTSGANRSAAEIAPALNANLSLFLAQPARFPIISSVSIPLLQRHESVISLPYHKRLRRFCQKMKQTAG